MRGVVRRDPRGADSHPLGGGDLVAHQREQRRDQERWPFAAFSQESGRDEVDGALPPARALHDEEPSAAFDEVFDRGVLTVTELRAWVAGAHSQQLERARTIEAHASRAAARPAPPFAGIGFLYRLHRGQGL